MRGTPVLLLIAIIAAAGLCGREARAAATDATIFSAYTTLDVALPNSRQVVICHGFGCSRLTPVAITAADRATLHQLMAGRATPQAERDAVAQAVAWFERRVAPAAGTAHARARANGLKDRDPSQFDCIDASRNTTSLLVVLEELDLLRHHKVAPIVARGFMLDGRYPHATAVLRELRSERRWAVDSWTHNNGEKPDVMPLDRWFAAR